MNKYKKLFNNSILFAIGNLGSKLITIIMVPFYTYELSTKQYGDVDLITTTVNMLVPVISLSMFDAVLRFAMDKHENNKSVLTNAIFVTIVGSIIFALIAFLLSAIFHINNIIYIYAILVTQVLQSSFSEYTRAINRIKLFAINGILGTVIIAISNLILMHEYKLNIDGYLLSMILSSITCTVFLFIKLKAWQIINFHYINKQQIQKMLFYSIPLIPNALSWWITNASNRYFILFFAGMSANGLFAVANKIPSILSIINSIFFQSWQLSAIEEYESIHKDEYYSNIFSAYTQLLFLCTSVIIMVLKPFLKFFVSNSYYISWELVPFLLLSVTYSSISSFLGTNYIAAKKTTGVMTTTIIGAILNVVFCLVLIPILGVNGAGIASATSFFIICICRLKDTKKFVNLKINYKMITLDHIIFFIQYAVLFLKINMVYVEIMELIILGVFIIINKNILIKMLRNFIGEKYDTNK